MKVEDKISAGDVNAPLMLKTLYAMPKSIDARKICKSRKGSSTDEMKGNPPRNFASSLQWSK